MKKIIVLTAVFLIITFCFNHAYGEVVVVKAKQGILKAAPGGEDIGTIIEGVTCEKIDEKEEWARVKLEGWIKNSDIIVLKIDKDKKEKEKKDYIEFTADRLSRESTIDTYEHKKVSFKGNFDGIFETERKVSNYVNFTVSSVECYIPTKNYSKIKDLKRGDSVQVYGKVKRGLRYPPWYYVSVDEIVKQ